MKSAQQLRDEELSQVVTPYLIADIANIIRDYTQESTLFLLELDAYGQALTSERNDEISSAIQEVFQSEDPDSELFGLEIINQHSRRLLDPVLTADLRAKDLPALLHNGADALKRRQGYFRAYANYLTYSQCEQRLKQKMSIHSNILPDSELHNVNVRLFFDAIKNIKPTAAKEVTRLQTLELMKVDFLKKQANAEKEKRNYAAAFKLSLEVLEILCGLNKKREVIELLIDLLDLGRLDNTHNFMDMLNLFSVAQELCMKYPADIDLYSLLLFAMDECCCAQKQYSMADRLYQQASADNIVLGRYGRAKFFYRAILANYHHTGKSGSAIMQAIVGALEYCSEVYLTPDDRINHNISFSDMSRIEFFYSFAMICRITSEVTEQNYNNFDRLTEQQRAVCLSFIKYEMGMNESLNVFCFENYPFLRFSVNILGEPTRAQLPLISAKYYKIALSLLLTLFQNYAMNSKNTKIFHNLIVSAYDQLFNFYRRHQFTAQMEQLVLRKNIKKIMHIQEFKDRLPGWRNQLKKMKTGT